MNYKDFVGHINKMPCSAYPGPDLEHCMYLSFHPKQVLSNVLCLSMVAGFLPRLAIRQACVWAFGIQDSFFFFFFFLAWESECKVFNHI